MIKIFPYKVNRYQKTYYNQAVKNKVKSVGPYSGLNMGSKTFGVISDIFDFIAKIADKFKK